MLNLESAGISCKIKTLKSSSKVSIIQIMAEKHECPSGGLRFTSDRRAARSEVLKITAAAQLDPGLDVIIFLCVSPPGILLMKTGNRRKVPR